MADTELKPCPFCGSTNLSIETNSVQPDDFHDAWVYCGECDAQGRHAMTLEGWLPTKAEAKEEAVVAWNRRATPPSPSTAPMCERKTAKLEEEGYAKTGYVLRQPGKDREVVVSDGGAVSWFTTEQWNWLMFNRDHVEFNWPKPIGARLAPSTAPEVDEMIEAVADFRKATYEFARGQDPSDHALMMDRQKRIFEIFRAALASRPAEVDDPGAEAGGREVVEQPETRMNTGFQQVGTLALEVDDEGLPPLPAPSARAYVQNGYRRASVLSGPGEPLFTAEQYRQGQRDAVAAYKRKQAALQELADQAQENGMGYGDAVAADRARREKGGA